MNYFRFLLAIFLCLTNLSSLAQTCNEMIAPTTPNDRFEIRGAEVKDMKTGLIWQRCLVGYVWNQPKGTCINTYPPELSYINWPLALSLADELWRLPNINELISITEAACTDPAINSSIFPNTPSGNYWSSTPVHTQSKIWVMSSSGNVSRYPYYHGGKVRLVR